MARTGMVHHRKPARWPVVVIGITKVFKTVGLLALGIGLHYVIAPERHQQIVDYVNLIRLDPHNQWLYWGLEKLLAVKPETLKFLRVGFFVYAALYGIEAVGLFLDRKWAEWMVVVTTAGFIPFEIYEIVREVTWVRCIMFGLNVGIMSFLIWRLWRQHVVRREAIEDAAEVTGAGAR